ncbi:hypothetical protein J4E86_008796 [Alternaria arbusti]|uniref:uncharacterized protein n=1 Tax=Alternaria arbusti TaxID=232088 RepID=UPI0022211CBD|nr:uncharacterized protein J4E86_008796 [Alternaria arbusti]KAI4947171.1 hypothetical protein J4E86_008796 [Alternaria arbusti]
MNRAINDDDEDWTNPKTDIMQLVRSGAVQDAIRRRYNHTYIGTGSLTSAPQLYQPADLSAETCEKSCASLLRCWTNDVRSHISRSLFWVLLVSVTLLGIVLHSKQSNVAPLLERPYVFTVFANATDALANTTGFKNEAITSYHAEIKHAHMLVQGIPSREKAVALVIRQRMIPSIQQLSCLLPDGAPVNHTGFSINSTLSYAHNLLSYFEETLEPVSKLLEALALDYSSIAKQHEAHVKYESTLTRKQYHPEPRRSEDTSTQLAQLDSDTRALQYTRDAVLSERNLWQ